MWSNRNLDIVLATVTSVSRAHLTPNIFRQPKKGFTMLSAHSSFTRFSLQLLFVFFCLLLSTIILLSPIATAGPLRQATGIVINEVDADTPGSDTAEFVELFKFNLWWLSCYRLILALRLRSIWLSLISCVYDHNISR